MVIGLGAMIEKGMAVYCNWFCTGLFVLATLAMCEYGRHCYLIDCHPVLIVLFRSTGKLTFLPIAILIHTNTTISMILVEK